jgi:hypothetical protein
MKCERCDAPIRESGTLPALELKTLGLYPFYTPITIGMQVTAFSSFSIDTGDAIISTVPITVPERFLPHNLHRIPGLPYNAYPMINGVAIRLSAAAAAPTVCALVLRYVDASELETLVLAYRMQPTLLQDSFISPLGAVVGSVPLGERPSSFGSWRLSGGVTMGACTGITVRVYANIGIAYGAPK